MADLSLGATTTTVAENAATTASRQQLVSGHQCAVEVLQIVQKIWPFRPNLANAAESTKKTWAAIKSDSKEFLVESIARITNLKSALAQLHMIAERTVQLSSIIESSANPLSDDVKARLANLLEALQKFQKHAELMQTEGSESNLMQRISEVTERALREEYPAPTSLQATFEMMKKCQEDILQLHEQLLTCYDEHFQAVSDLRQKQGDLEHLKMQIAAQKARISQLKEAKNAVELQKQAALANTEEQRKALFAQAEAQQKSLIRSRETAEEAFREQQRVFHRKQQEIRDALDQSYQQLQADLAQIQ